MSRDTHDLTGHTALIVACYLSRNPLPPTELPSLIAAVSAALRTIAGGSRRATRAPAVPAEESVTEDYLICLEDGRKLRMLRRYLQQKYGLSPEEYRARWNLSPSYPMVAPSYAALRSAIGKRRSRPPRPA